MYVYESSVKNQGWPNSGLRIMNDTLEKQNPDFKEGLSICMRFYYELLGWGSTLFVHEVKGFEEVHHFYWMFAGYKESFLFFATQNWLIKDLDLDTYQIWNTNQWHHFCLSYNKNSSYISLIKVLYE